MPPRRQPTQPKDEDAESVDFAEPKDADREERTTPGAKAGKPKADMSLYRPARQAFDKTERFLGKLVTQGFGAVVFLYDLAGDAQTVEEEPQPVRVVSSFARLPGLLEKYPAPVKDVSLMVAASLHPDHIPNNTLRNIHHNISKAMPSEEARPGLFGLNAGLGCVEAPKGKQPAVHITRPHKAANPHPPHLFVYTTRLTASNIQRPWNKDRGGPGPFKEAFPDSMYAKENIHSFVLQEHVRMGKRAANMSKVQKEVYAAKRNGTFVRKQARVFLGSVAEAAIPAVPPPTVQRSSIGQTPRPQRAGDSDSDSSTTATPNVPTTSQDDEDDDSSFKRSRAESSDDDDHDGDDEVSIKGKSKAPPKRQRTAKRKADTNRSPVLTRTSNRNAGVYYATATTTAASTESTVEPSPTEYHPMYGRTQRLEYALRSPSVPWLRSRPFSYINGPDAYQKKQ